MPFYRVGNRTLRYQVTGNGSPLLLLGGVGRSLEHWVDLESALVPHRQIVAVDLRGTGGSDSPVGFYSTGDLASEVALLLDGIGFSDPLDVFGCCLGGMVAQELVLRFPGKVRALALASTSPGGDTALSLSPAALGSLLLDNTLPEQASIRLSDRWFSSASFLGAHPEVVDRWVRIHKKWPPTLRGLVGQIAAMRQHATMESLSKIECPTLLIHGGRDRVVPPCNSTLLAAGIPRAQLQWFPEAGHDIAAEQPQELATVLDRFFSRPSHLIPEAVGEARL